MKKSWYKTWFNSNYYHILYHHRDETEAGEFLDRLITAIPLEENSRIIDIGCGKGRHAIYLNKRGFEVDGIDLSKASIASARQSENDRLSFYVHDMREVFKAGHYDYVLNLFTSFGYFEEESDDLRSMQAMAANLKPGGRLILDYLNPDKVEEELGPDCIEHHLKIKGISFRIEKDIVGNFIEKKIKITEDQQEHLFYERVKRLKQEHFTAYMEKSGLEIEKLYGNYQLDPFDGSLSERMIFIARKK